MVDWVPAEAEALLRAHLADLEARPAPGRAGPHLGLPQRRRLPLPVGAGAPRCRPAMPTLSVQVRAPALCNRPL